MNYFTAGSAEILTRRICAIGPRDTVAAQKETIRSLKTALKSESTYVFSDQFGNVYYRGRREKFARPALFMAHYDTVPGTVGANDNASGVAAMLMLISAQAEEGIPADFLFTNREEPPYFASPIMGSYNFFRKHDPGYYQLVVNLDCVGFGRVGGDLHRCGYSYLVESKDEALLRAFDSAGLERATDHYTRLSDLRNVADKVPAVHVHDDTVRSLNNFHCPEDTPDTLDYDKMSELVARTWAAVKNYTQIEVAQ